jgi:hypothetical protein
MNCYHPFSKEDIESVYKILNRSHIQALHYIELRSKPSTCYKISVRDYQESEVKRILNDLYYEDLVIQGPIYTMNSMNIIEFHYNITEKGRKVILYHFNRCINLQPNKSIPRIAEELYDTYYQFQTLEEAIKHEHLVRRRD